MMATSAAIIREASNASLTIPFGNSPAWVTPTVGRMSLVLAEFVVVMVLCFYGLHPSDQWEWEDIGYRTGFIACCQLPLIVLLAGKNNIIGFLVGVSYEKLNWLHRWTARMLLLTVTIHMGYWFADWYRYDYITVKLKTDAITQRGFAAWVILVWIVFSSMAPIRRWNYEFFVVQHIITYVGFLAAVYLHLPAEVKVWVWIPIVLVILDRTLRSLSVVCTNVSIFHPTARRRSFWASKATFEPLDPETTRITIASPPLRWTAGQHVLLSCHTIAPLQSHPFTVASIPSDGKMVFLVKSKAGGTKRYLRYAEKLGLPLTETPMDHRHHRAVTIEGPYGRMRPLKQFDSVMLIAGSSGGTFTIPLLRDVIQSMKSGNSGPNPRWSWMTNPGAATRYIRFVWVVKSRAQYSWFSAQLVEAMQDVAQLRRQGHDVELETSIYVTCDEDFIATSKNDPPQVGCGSRELSALKPVVSQDEKPIKDDTSPSSISSKSSIEQFKKPSCGPNGTCCCQTTIEDEDAITNATACECHCGSDVSSETAEKPVTPQDSISSDQPLTPAKPEYTAADTESMTMLSGRPQPRTLIRKMLEQALGESAVVVCGPKGLVTNARQSVVSLSDERAIHKGTGAQGCYLHAEAFDY